MDDIAARIASLPPERRRALELLLSKRGVPAAEEAIPRRADAGPAPLSFQQQRVWLLDQLDPGNSSYNLPVDFRLEGLLNHAALEQSICEITRRHESLRTTFEARGGESVQVVNAAVNLCAPLVDLSGLTEEEQERQAMRLGAEETRQSFDLERGPVSRFLVLRLRARESVLLHTTHHIVSDGWSRAGVFLRELAALYPSFDMGEPSPLPELEIQYADFAVWQRRRLQGELLEKHLDYWRRQLAGAPALLELPTDRPRPPVQTFEGDLKWFRTSEALTQRLRALAAAEKTSLFTVLLAGLQATLCRYAGQEDVSVGTFIANRNRKQVEDLIGFFINTLVLRTDLSGDPTFRELVGRARDTAIGAYAHQDLPFEALLEELRPERSLSHTPFFQVMLTLQNMPRHFIELPHLFIHRPRVVPKMRANFDLTLMLWDVDGAVEGFAVYNTDLFDGPTVARLLGNYETLLEAASSDPQQRLSALPLLNEAERHQLLVEWGDAGAEAASDECAHAGFESNAAHTPDAVALVHEEEHLTYRVLNERANRLARRLRASGVEAGSHVCILLERSPELIISILATLKAGGVFVPLDPTHPLERLRFMLEDTRARVLLTSESLSDAIPRTEAHVVFVDSRHDSLASERGEDLRLPLTPEHPAYVIYTSGSTGRPKGVVVQHRALSTYTRTACRAYELGPSDRVLQFASATFDASLEEIFPALASGAALVLRTDSMLDSVETFLRRCREWQLTMLDLPTAYWHELTARLSETNEAFPDVSRLVIIGGEKASAEHLERWRARVPACVRLVNTYGPTETTIVATMCDLSGPADGPTREVPIGRAVSNVNTYLLDKNLRPIPHGVKGELHVGGPDVALGYLNRPDLTAEKFIPDAFGTEPGARLYKTGDLGRHLADGRIEFAGRRDQQAKIRGYRIELGEVEDALNQHPRVREAVVLAREDAPGNRRLVAYVVEGSRGEQAGRDDEQVSQWREVYDEGIYKDINAEDSGPRDADFNVAGWNSSYTGLPIPEEEMREWVEQTVGRILSLGPRRVWEIGCGTGLLLFRVAPRCELYRGTDFSPVALEYLRSRLDASGAGWPQVALDRREADDFEGVEPHSFDTLILNSVIQYFPHAEYLARVLEGAARVIRPGGKIFLGDVRSLPLLEAFHASIELHQAPAALPAESFRRRVRKRVAEERELVIDPSFFVALKRRIPRIRDVEVRLKRGRHHNELTRFRYDVTLHVGGEPRPAQEMTRLDWQERKPAPADLRRMLAETEPELLCVTRVPDARLSAENMIAALLKQDVGPQTVSELRDAARAARGTGIDPEELWELEGGLPYHVDVRPSPSAGFYDVFFKRRTFVDGDAPLIPGLHDGVVPETLERYANNPLQATLSKGLLTELRAFLEQRLPPYMVPSAFVTLDALPLTSSGKVDRRALPAPEQSRPEIEDGYVAPRSGLEETLCKIWSEVLGLECVGVNDNFFNLGGHSLLATQVVSRVRDTLRVEAPLRWLFDKPTVAEFADRVKGELVSTADADAAAVTRFERRDGEPAALSYAQRRLWFMSQLEPDSPAYNIHAGIRFRGSLNAEALAQCLDEVARRHESLRTVFVTSEDGEAAQLIAPARAAARHAVDLRGLDEEARSSVARRLGREESELPFDLARGPLLRACLLRTEEHEHVLLLTMHHIASDAWSVSILIQEVATFYNAYAAGAPSPLAELEVQYADFAQWQRRWLDGGALETQLAYWKRQLKGAPPLLRLPTDRPRPTRPTYRGASHAFALSAELTESLRAFSRREGVTMFMTLLAVYKALLQRYTSQGDIVVGADVANRNRTETEGLIGFFINMLVLRADLSDNPSFRELLRRVRKTTLEAYDHQDLPFEKLVEHLQPERSLGHSPLFQVVFDFFNIPDDGGAGGPELKGLTLSAVAPDRVLVRFDLSLFMSEGPDGLNGSWKYSTDLFDAQRIERMHAHFETLLRSAVASPDARLDALEMQTEEERRRHASQTKALKDANFRKFIRPRAHAPAVETGEAG